MSTVRDIMKKAICIAITAALVVAFSFALVACNDNSSVTTQITGVKDAAITDLRTALENSGNASSFRGVIKQISGDATENSTVSVYANGRDSTVYIDKEIFNAKELIEREYVMAGIATTGRVYAIARYDGDATSPSRSVYYNGEDNTYVISDVITNSNVRKARTDLLNILDNCVSLTGSVTTSGNVSEYSLTYDTERIQGTLSVKTENGVVTFVENVSDGTTFSTEYTYNIGSMAPEGSSTWYEKHPRTV